MIGTTPKHTFTLPVDTGNIKTIRVNYAQRGKLILTKKDADVRMEGNTVSLQLTQEDTFLFDHDCLVAIQIRGLTVEGEAIKSKIISVTPDQCLDEEVLT